MTVHLPTSSWRNLVKAFITKASLSTPLPFVASAPVTPPCNELFLLCGSVAAPPPTPRAAPDAGREVGVARGEGGFKEDDDGRNDLAGFSGASAVGLSGMAGVLGREE